MPAPSMPTKAQARRLAELWAGSRALGLMVTAPPGRRVFNDPTDLALKRRHWIRPTGHAPVQINGAMAGYECESYELSFDGMVALHRFIGREIKLSEDALE